MEPEKYLAMNWVELIAHTESLAAELAGVRSDLALCEAKGSSLEMRARVKVLEAALAQVAADLAYQDDVSLIARIAAAQQTLKSVFTLRYPCGCEASGAALPTYCPEHGLSVETPVSTLCAVCDQIKELHPSTHPWTAKTVPGFCSECLMTGGHKLSCSKAETGTAK